ncbi:MAG: hypothetical protein Q9191_004085 [Dirinaria sp. TL-2023a]
MSSSNYPGQPTTQLTERLSVWCLWCLVNLCELDRVYSRVFLVCPACKGKRHRFTTCIDLATQQPVVHPSYQELRPLFPSPPPPHINADPRRAGMTPTFQALQPSPDPTQGEPDPYYQGPYGDYPYMYPSPSPYIEHQSLPSSAPSTGQENMYSYGNQVPTANHATSAYRLQPLVATATATGARYAGVTKSAPKKRAGRPSKALDDAAKQAALLAEMLEGTGVQVGAAEQRIEGWAVGVEDLNGGTNDEPQQIG